jgi:type VI secretion system protein ImpC
MTAIETAVEQEPLTSLALSLNYQADVLTSLLKKKQRLLGLDALKEKLQGLFIPLAELGDKPKLPKIEKALADQQLAITAAETLVTALEEEVKQVEDMGEVISALNSLKLSVTKYTVEVSELKTTPDEDKLAKLQNDIKELNNSSGSFLMKLNKLDEAVQTEKVLSLEDAEQAADYFLSSLATVLFNDILPNENDDPGSTPLAIIRRKADNLVAKINRQLDDDLNSILHNEKFKKLEANWVGLNNLIESTDWSAGIMIDMLDCAKEEEVAEDLQNNANGLINSELFKKVYVAEYDQFGGLPYGAIIGLYDFKNTKEDLALLKTMGQLCNASHAPFISTVGPQFFGCKNIEEMAEIRDLEAYMSHPRFERWQALRDTDEAAYIGLTLPRFLLRAPYHPQNNPAGHGLSYEERINMKDGGDDFLWCNAALLFAKNMIQSFAHSGWCQYIRGPKGGGKVEHLPRYAFNLNGQMEIKAPIELVIPDYRELAFADAGFIPLVYRKGSADACFFSSQSIKKSKLLKDKQLQENSQLVTNLAYTLSITRIAHYVKCIMRDNIGSAADGAYINNVLQTWLSKYVTTVVNPDDLTLRYYPFKAAQVSTIPKEGMIGWYNSEITILPHIQFEGLDVELRMDVRI